MANVLDLRRRIRSVKNTRQITKAMKMVSAAKLRRAQERALMARPYARMITSVLESLTRRVDIYDEKTGNLAHPLFISGWGQTTVRGASCLRVGRRRNAYVRDRPIRSWHARGQRRRRRLRCW